MGQEAGQAGVLSQKVTPAMIEAATDVLLLNFGEPTGSVGRLRRIAREAIQAGLAAASPKGGDADRSSRGQS